MSRLRVKMIKQLRFAFEKNNKHRIRSLALLQKEIEKCNAQLPNEDKIIRAIDVFESEVNHYE